MVSASRQAHSRGSDVRDRLVAAARQEFSEHGYLGTNTNRIARRARVSAQTFYRYFDDKLAVFRQVYVDWISESWAHIREAAASARDPDDVGTRVAAAVVAHYRRGAAIRADIRMLSTSEQSFRDLYLAEGRRQMEITRANRLARGQAPLSPEEGVAALVIVERLADALAFAEVGDLGADAAAFERLLAGFIAHYVQCSQLWPVLAPADSPDAGATR